MAGNYDGGGDVRRGGFFVHFRDLFGRCEWALVTAAHPKDQALNLKVMPNDPDHSLWKPACKHGAAKGEWHHPDQCAMTTQQMREDEQKALGAVKDARVKALAPEAKR